MDRRKFIQTGALSLALAGSKGFAQNDSLQKPRTLGLIGSGWYGKSALFRLLQIAPVEVAALCDVDQNMLNEAAEMVAERQKSKQKPRTYRDYRELLKNEKLDIVMVSTPDHWHALPMIDAVKAGADVWVEKPICVDVVEGQAMLAAARKYNRVVQVNTERRSTPHLVEARDTIVRAGKLGKIAHVETYCYYHMGSSNNPQPVDPPEHLDYEMWTGPAPMRPYTPMVHPRGWRAFMEYGNGIVGDMGIHMYDMVRWMMDLGWPKRVSSSGGIYVRQGGASNISDTQTVTFEHDGLNIVWQHRTWGADNKPKFPWGATIYGDKGTLTASVMGYEFTPLRGGDPISKEVAYEYEQYPEDKTEKDLERHVAPALRAHWKNFLEAIDNRSKPVADIEEAFISSAACIMGNLSMKSGRTMEYDPATGKIVGDEELNKLLRRPYREPWVHPEPDAV